MTTTELVMRLGIIALCVVALYARFRKAATGPSVGEKKSLPVSEKNLRRIGFAVGILLFIGFLYLARSTGAFRPLCGSLGLAFCR